MATKAAQKAALQEEDHFATSAKISNPVRSKPNNSQRATNVLVGLITASLPIYLYSAIFEMLPQHFAILYAALTLVAAALLSFSYQNVAYSQFVELFTRRQLRIERSKKAASGITDRQILGSSLLAKEATSWSFIYVNVLFLSSVVILSFFFFGNHLGPYNYALTMLVSSAIVLFVSGGAIR